MCCEEQGLAGRKSDGSDGLQLVQSARLFDRTGTAWLLGQAVRYLNTEDKEGEVTYGHTIQLLQRSSDETLKNVQGLFGQVNSADSMLRWNLLHVLSDAGDARAVDFLVRTALRALPEENPDAGCQSVRDDEILVATMAVHALHKIAVRHSEVASVLLKVVEAKPAQPILIEAIKVAVQHGLADRVAAALPKDDHWMLGISQRSTQEMFADPERHDSKEVGYTPPKLGTSRTAPNAACCIIKEN